MTPAWKASVEAELIARGWNRSELAERAGLHKTVISSVLSERQVSSDAVPIICKVLNLPMPVLGVDDEIVSNLGKLSPEDKRAVLDLIRRLAE